MLRVISFKLFIKFLLIFLTLIDIFLIIMGLVFPAVWLKWIHGVYVPDHQGLMIYIGGIWLAFASLQILATILWENHVYWLAVIAGVRWTESCAGWLQLMAANDLSAFGKIFLASVPAANLVFGYILIRCYQELRTFDLREKPL